MLCGAVFCGVPPRCVLCAVCVLSWPVGARCCSPLCVVLCVSWGVVLCVPCLPRSVRCFATLCWCACVVLFVSCVLLLAPGAVVRCCVLHCFLWCSVVRCWVWSPVVVCWWCLSVSVSLSGCVVCFPVVGVVCCVALSACVVFCGAVRSRGAVLLCSAVVLRCCWCLFCPPVACCAVLCCAVGCLCCFLPGGGVCVLWCPFPPCRQARKTLFLTLCYPAPVSESVVHVVGESGFAVRRVIVDFGRVVLDEVVLLVVALACLQRNGGRTGRGWGRDGKERYMENKTKREGASWEA